MPGAAHAPASLFGGDPVVFGKICTHLVLSGAPSLPLYPDTAAAAPTEQARCTHALALCAPFCGPRAIKMLTRAVRLTNGGTEER